MSATAAHAHPRALDPPRTNKAPDELQLACIVCRGEVGRTEKVAYWPPTADRVGVIAHVRCLNVAGSL